MTRLSLIILVFVLGSICSKQANGQIIDSLPPLYNTSPSMFYEAADLNALKGDFTPFVLPGYKGFANQQVTYARKLKLPKTSQVSNGPIYISNTLKCYKVNGPKGKQGTIVWWDRNGDLKIQPLRELRCVSPNGKATKVYVEEVSCK